MGTQQSFTDMEYANRKRQTKRDEFLKSMEEVIPWDEWTALVDPTKRGRSPHGVETMLGCIGSPTGLRYPTKAWRMPFMTAIHFGNP